MFDGPTNLSTFSTSLLFDEPNSVEPRAVSYDPILALDLPYNGEWSAAIQNYNPEPGTVANLLSASATALQQRALINVSDQAAKRSFDTKLPLIAASPDSGATASITDNCLNLQNSKPCDEIFGAANGAVTRCSCIGDMPIITRTTDGQLVRFKFTNVRCVPGFRYTLLSVTHRFGLSSASTRDSATSTTSNFTSRREATPSPTTRDRASPPS